MRRVFLGLSLLTVWLLLLGWAAHVPFGSPWMPQQKLNFPGSEFRVVMGAGAVDEQRLKVNAIGSENSALQSVTLNSIAAADFPLLRYEFADFPRVLELSLIFRRADKPEDVQVVALPWPREGKMSFDLTAIDEWRGEIIELGFAEFPTGQLVPPGYGFTPFTLDSAQLSSISWRGKLEALVSDWFSAWPWSQRSVHALGRDTDTPRQRSFEVIIAVGIALTLLLFGLFRVISWRSLPKTAGTLILIGWLVLDVVWQQSLAWKHAATRDLYGGKTWQERKRLVADKEVLDAAERIQVLLHDEPASTRILVHSNSHYELMRLIYHLLPANVVPFVHAVTNSQGVVIPAGTIVIFYGEDAPWEFDPATRSLVSNGSHVPVEPLLETDTFRVYRLGATQ